MAHIHILIYIYKYQYKSFFYVNIRCNMYRKQCYRFWKIDKGETQTRCYILLLSIKEYMHSLKQKQVYFNLFYHHGKYCNFYITFIQTKFLPEF